MRFAPSAAALLMLSTIAAFALPAAAAEDGARQKIAALVRQLDDQERAQRDDAEKQLVELGLAAGADGAADFIAALPKPNENMPQEVQTRLARIRGQIQAKTSRKAVAESTVTLDVKEAPLADVLKDIEKQTGNKLIDYREKYGQEVMEKKVTLKLDKAPFWSALDQLLDGVNMAPYAFTGESALGLIEREPGALRRFGRATYAGPFRVEATKIYAQRGLRSPDQSSMNIDLELSWEPRLEPLSISQAAADLKAVGDDGRQIPAVSEDAVFNVDVTRGSYAADATLGLKLPAREAKMLTSLKGKMMALVPGKIVDLEFDKLKNAKQVKQETGGVTVTLDRVVKNQALWEVHMRVKLNGLDGGIPSDQGWVFQNITYLKDKNGEHIDHAGFETEMQTETEAGFAYFFETPDDIDQYTWVYRTPTAIVNMPVVYELKDVPLP
jgi:hypothetical protein